MIHTQPQHATSPTTRTAWTPRTPATHTIAIAIAILLSGAESACAQSPTLLSAGMELVYESNGATTAPWRVESVDRSVSLGGRSGCLRVRFAPGGPRPDADVRTTCAADSLLYAWDTRRMAWRPSRPIEPNRTLETATRTGTVTYRTHTSQFERVGSLTVRVIETTVLTSDSTGRPVRRLRERYAPELGTATWGVLETPDPSVDGGWVVVQEFRLVDVRLIEDEKTRRREAGAHSAPAPDCIVASL